MVLALKLISAGVSYQDGLRKSEVISLTDMSPLSHEKFAAWLPEKRLAQACCTSEGCLM